MFLRKAAADISRLIPEFTDLLDKIGIDLSTENSAFVMATCGGCIHSPGTEHILDLIIKCIIDTNCDINSLLYCNHCFYNYFSVVTTVSVITCLL